jgi:adenosylhomocysteine nucleosidase
LNGLGIVAALAAEARPLGVTRRELRQPIELADGALLMLSGVGPAAARDGARRLAAAGVGALLSWGMAGALDPVLAPGTLIVPAEVVSPDGVLYATAREWRERVSCAIPATQPLCAGRLLTAAEALGSLEAKSLAFRRTAAVAVDMESSAIAEIAAAARLPFLAVRAIVDGASDPVPRAALTALTPGTDSLHIGRVLAALVRAPGELPALIRLGGSYRSARRALTTVARAGALKPAIPGAPLGTALP